MSKTRMLRRRFTFALGVLAVAAAAAAALAVTAPAASDNAYMVTRLVSDRPGDAAQSDGNLVNAWGLDALAGSPWWVADNGKGVSTIYRADGTTGRPPVNVPGRPTGLVANSTQSFKVSDGTTTAAPLFIFASEEGKIFGWNPGIAPNDAVDAHVENTAGAIYKGLAIASTPGGDQCDRQHQKNKFAGCGAGFAPRHHDGETEFVAFVIHERSPASLPSASRMWRSACDASD